MNWEEKINIHSEVQAKVYNICKELVLHWPIWVMVEKKNNLLASQGKKISSVLFLLQPRFVKLKDGIVECTANTVSLAGEKYDEVNIFLFPVEWLDRDIDDAFKADVKSYLENREWLDTVKEMA